MVGCDNQRKTLSHTMNMNQELFDSFSMLLNFQIVILFSSSIVHHCSARCILCNLMFMDKRTILSTLRYLKFRFFLNMTFDEENKKYRHDMGTIFNLASQILSTVFFFELLSSDIENDFIIVLFASIASLYFIYHYANN